MKDVELRLVAELMRNSRRSDRELAKVLGVSQPTVGRAIKKLEKEGVAKEYTMIPDFAKIGFNILSVTFVSWDQGLNAQEYARVIDAGIAFDKEKKTSLIMASQGFGEVQGLMIISLHETYSDSREFLKDLGQLPYSERASFRRFMVDLAQSRYRTLTMSSLTECLEKRVGIEKTDKHRFKTRKNA